ncbi:KpsF/GutQ family sugar-phosphate isomerase [Marinicella sp. S1101]|uniref:KpsF/GutQ family sugar-phosphate isomerase n=1 Tax=Marinicella marina TaxID=2996016 RepID=UPI002260EA3B|nr:KpsF/GutQ family sugar-phosphate isomerase [Marinicella marina]MCX7554625.1 KpsF/GutQ family sugar-phosphate isomerase [Marinicella marina]MDJ1140690.1 KpsF/GutQ family sugar-phosphate isomerase [Marinicella marina]
MTTYDSKQILQQAQSVFAIELAGIKAIEANLGADFVAAVNAIMTCRGHVVVIGMGKSGHIGNKISATLASTGTPAFFVHPGEASHGDLGMITAGDVVLAISNSGETEEVLTILPVIKRMGAKLISMTGNVNSSLAKNADIHLEISVPEEACPLGLAPTASTTATLVMGDALAVTLLELRGFTKEDFARSHPAGSLGKKLLLGIKDVMRTGADMPTVTQQATFSEALVEMNLKGLGMTAVVDDKGAVIGVFTDGDLRRTINQFDRDKERPIAELATKNPVMIRANKMAVEAAQIMEQHKIHALLVVDASDQLVGALNIHDLLRAGVV